MSGADTADFIAYWIVEGERYERHGDYDWMAAQTADGPVLELGCGVGCGTRALLAQGRQVLALDSLAECLIETGRRVDGLQPALTTLQADLLTLNDAEHQILLAFAPTVVVCWLMGAPAEITGAGESDAGKAVAAYRERVQRVAAELAASLPSVRYLHYVDRTAIPWQAKDIGRDTLVRYHVTRTLLDLPFRTNRGKALYRKMEGGADLADARRAHPSLKGIVPALASLVAERIT